VEICLLGPLEVRDDQGGAVRVAGAKLRGLLALLALRPGRVVPVTTLVEALWGEDAPGTAGNSLQVLVAKLRRVLPDGLVLTRPPGYLLDLPAEAVDVIRFERLATLGRKALAGQDARAAATFFSGALDLWHGQALADFAGEDFAQADIARLGEARLAILEDRFEAELACGEHGSLIGDLEAAIAAEPFRERLRGQLMLALYRSGRQADALAHYRDARKLLDEELGIEPGVQLRQMEAAILAQDPALDAVPARPAAAPHAADAALVPDVATVATASDAAPAPAPVSASRTTNVRAPLTATIGRAAELAAVGELVRAHRLVTLVGPGGVGKTRLAVEVARHYGAAFAAGAWLVELAPLVSPQMVTPTIAAALRLAVAGAVSQAEAVSTAQLADAVAQREALVVLDNCEHLIGEVASVTAELLGSCPALHILATSREGLGLPGERWWPVPPIPLPDAIQLFAERAEAVAPGFVATQTARPMIAGICRRLDCLPLAIELAAARLRALPLPQVAARLDDRFTLLDGGMRTALPRHQTLRAVIDWSYDALFDEERLLLQRVSVFAGSFDLAAAESVCADERLGAAQIAGTLARLVDKSLLTADTRGPEARYTMLESLRQYGHGKLAEAGEVMRWRHRHAEYFLGVTTGPQWPAMSWFVDAGMRGHAPDLDNFNAALDLARTLDPGTHLRLAIGVAPLWHALGRYAEGAAALRAAMRRDPVPEAMRHQALECVGWLTVQCDSPAACAVAEEILASADALGASPAAGLAAAGIAGHMLGHHDQAAASLAEARDAYHRQGDADGERLVIYHQAVLAFQQGDLARSGALLEELIASASRDGRHTQVGYAYLRRYLVPFEAGRVFEAREAWRETAVLYGHYPFTVFRIAIIGGGAVIAAGEGRATRVVTILARVQQLMDDSGWNRDGWMRTWISQRLLAPAIAMLTPEQIREAQRAGQSMTEEEALAYALAEAD
jgi:predicted ATPase/DNA-binding SARP family transcriptional activator